MHENIYRKEGSPEVDKAWEALGVDCQIPFPLTFPTKNADNFQIEQA